MHEIDLRIYYEDTDAAGIVYYANYLKFIERARSEWVRGLGIDQVALREDHGLVFVVRRVEAEYLKPAKFDDLVAVRTDLVTETGARLLLAQEVWRGQERLFAAMVTMVCVTAEGQVARLPAEIRRLLAPALH